MSLAESLNWEQEEQCTSVFPRSVTNRKNQENLKLSEKKELLKKMEKIYKIFHIKKRIIMLEKF